MSSLPFSFHRFRKIRLYLAWSFAIALAIFSESTSQGFLIGAPVILIGEIIRIWSHGYLRKLRELAMSGPYAYVRNPLYIGNFLIGIGFCLILWHPVIAIIFVVGFFLVYWVTIKGEEERLSSKFGDAYAHYVRHVPRLIPRSVPYKDKDRLNNVQFQFYRVWGHGEHITILATVVLLLTLYLRQELYQERHPVTGITFWIFISAVMLALGIVFAMTARYGYDIKRFLPFWSWLAGIQKRTRRWRNWQTRKT